jgi:SHS family lactate transporter-like MFS transporter
MISSASAQIEATAGEKWKTTIIKNGKPAIVPDYAKVNYKFKPQESHFACLFNDFIQVQGLLIGVVAAFVVFITVIGPEYVISSYLSSLLPDPTFSFFSF